MAAIQSHRDLIVWQKAVRLVEEIYQVSARLPSSETYGPVLQMKRAAVSVPANIAEGHARSSRRDYAQFVSIARSSLMETETLLTIAQRLGYADPATFARCLQQIEEISKMLTVLRQRLVHLARPE
jgi:four helix bundle protein